MILAVLQARTSSSRMPGKVLKPILGVPMIGRQIERIKYAKMIDRLVVATSDEASDDPVAAYCASIEMDCFRGSLNDVLGRMAGAAAAFGPAHHVVRLTADCPLADPDIIDGAIDKHLRTEADYTANAIARTFADGLDVEVMRAQVLAAAAEEASEQMDREHVTRFIYMRPRRFTMAAFTQDFDQASWRWTVDNPEDFDMVEKVYEGLYERNPKFNSRDVERFIKLNPEIAALNNALGPDLLI